MAAKKRTTRAVAKPRTTAAPAKRRRSSAAMKGVAKIPKMGAATGFIVANWDPISWTVTNSIKNPKSAMDYAKAAGKKMIQSESLVKDAQYMLAGYIAGKVVKKYAPKAIKKPVAKIADKVM